MIDLHCHVLPGVDDGAPDLADTLTMARAAVEQGCRAIAATSHLWEGLFGTSPELLEEELPSVVEAVRNAGIPLEVLPGAENYFAGGDPERFAARAVPLCQGSSVLVDFSLDEVPDGIIEMIGAFAARGRRPVIAHPERNRELQADPTPIADWIERGAIIQVNASSMLGIHGEEARDAAELLLESGAVHVLASDAHDLRRRPFCLGRGRERAAELVGADEAARLAVERPWRVARGEPIEVVRPTLAPRAGRGLLRRILPRREQGGSTEGRRD
jgi:protein-tyrosine phosphatase